VSLFAFRAVYCESICSFSTGAKQYLCRTFCGKRTYRFYLCRTNLYVLHKYCLALICVERISMYLCRTNVYVLHKYCLALTYVCIHCMCVSYTPTALLFAFRTAYCESICVVRQYCFAHIHAYICFAHVFYIRIASLCAFRAVHYDS